MYAGWVDQGARVVTCRRLQQVATALSRARPTPGCFLSPGHWKVGIMPGKGKGPKVLAVTAR